jgi:hypothetical protein
MVDPVVRAVATSVFAATTGALVMASSTVLMPAALSLGPCLGVALLAGPVTGAMQIAFGVVHLSHVAARGNRREWLAATILL